MDKEEFLVIYKFLIRTHLEYCVQNWNPHLIKDEEVLEKVQRRATRYARGMKVKSIYKGYVFWD